MKTLLLSDIHMGDPRFQNDKQLSKLIESEEFDQIILVGDIVDLWMPWYKEVCYNSRTLRALSVVKAKVVWVIGNHDDGINTKKFLPNAESCQYYEFLDKYKFVAIHGHQVYPFKNMAAHSKFLSVINAYLFKWFNIDFQWFRNKWPLLQSAQKRRHQIIDRYGHLGDIIIMGHTHIKTHQVKDNIDLYDLGSIVLKGTYGVIENGNFSFRKLKE